MKIIFVSLMLLLIVGCKIVTEEYAALQSATGKLRHELFVECMELAAKMPRQADDDVSDIVNECSIQSNYMATHISG